MIERELYIKVLDCLHDEQYLAKKVQMIQEILKIMTHVWNLGKMRCNQ